MSSAGVVAGSSLGETSGSMSVDNPSSKGTLSSKGRGRKRPSLLADLSWGKESKVEKSCPGAEAPSLAAGSSGVMRSVGGEVLVPTCPIESSTCTNVADKVSPVVRKDEEVKIVGQTAMSGKAALSAPGSTAGVGEVEEGREGGERPRKMSKVSGEDSSNEGCEVAEPVTALGAALKEKAHVAPPVSEETGVARAADRDLYHLDPCLGDEGVSAVEPEIYPCLGGKGGSIVEPVARMPDGEMVVVAEEYHNSNSNSNLLDHKSTGEEVLEKGGEVEGVAVVVLHDRTDHSSMNDKSTREEEVLETRYHDATANLLPGGGCGGMELVEGRVPSSSVDDPKGWGDLLRRVPEVGPSSTGGGVDFDATYDEFASSIFRLVGIKNRAMREYESAARRSKGELARLEEQIAELRRLNDDLSEQKVALVGSREEERCLRQGVEDSLREKTIELEALKVGLEHAEGQARLKEEEVRILGLRLEKAGEDRGEVEELREKVARLESEAARHQGEIIAMDQGCRATLRRLLKQQAAALYSGYEAKNGCMGLKLDHFLESRAAYDKVVEELHRAEGALNALKSLKEKDGVPVPDSKFADLTKVVDFQKRRAGNHVVEDFHSGKLLLGLPEGIGAIDVERLDFKLARYALVREEGDESSAGAAEGETEESPTVGSEGGEGGCK